MDASLLNHEPRLNYGIVLFYQKQFQESAKRLRKAIEKRETSAAAHFFWPSND